MSKGKQIKHVNCLDQRAAAIWDFDGLLVDTIPLHQLAWKRCLVEHDLKYDETVLRRVSGCRDMEIGEEFLKWQVGFVEQNLLNKIVIYKQALFSDQLAMGINLHSGVEEWIRSLSDMGFSQAIASSTSMYNIQKTLSIKKLESFFDVVVSGETDIDLGKPAPDIFLLASKRLNVEPSRCIVLEDAAVGVSAAKAAGMFCIAVTNTQQKNELIDADVIVDSLASVLPNICLQWLTEKRTH